MDDPFADLGATKSPCGCKDKGGDPALASGDPDAAALMQALDALEAEGGGDLELAGLESALEELILLAEQHPGLKVTISF